VLIIGIAWPMLLSVMQGAGLARKPQPRVKLPKGRKAAEKKLVDNTEGDKQLAEMNAALEAQMAGFVGPNLTNDPDESRAGMPAIKPLTAGPAVAAAAAKEDDEVDVKDYGGEFYPVVKGSHKEHKQELAPQTKEPAKK
jgi:hypothetical protein